MNFKVIFVQIACKTTPSFTPSTPLIRINLFKSFEEEKFLGVFEDFLLFVSSWKAGGALRLYHIPSCTNVTISVLETVIHLNFNLTFDSVFDSIFDWPWQTSWARRAWSLLQKTESFYKIAGFANLVLFFHSGR